MKNKTRADWSLVIGVAIGIAVLTIISILNFSITEDARDSGTDTTYSVTNETLATVTETGELVANYNQCGFADLSVSVITRAAQGNTIDSTNYTINTTSGLIKFTGANVTYNNTNWNVSYTYVHQGTGCNATIEADKAQFKLFSNLDLVALAVIFGLIIFILLKVLPVNVSGF